jgi:hypothetical protein
MIKYTIIKKTLLKTVEWKKIKEKKQYINKC